jgi:hypothetical protein
MNNRTSDYYPVAWVITKFARKEVWAGFCGKTKHLFTLARNNLSPLIVNDLIATDDECEEGGRCLYFKCPLNQTSPKTFLRDAGFTKRRGGKPANPSIGEIMWPDSLGELRSAMFGTKAGKPALEVVADTRIPTTTAR